MEEHLVPRRCRGSLPTNSTVRVKNRDARSLLTGIYACTQINKREETHTASALHQLPCREGQLGLELKELSPNRSYTKKRVYGLRMELQETVCISSSFQISFLSCYNFEGASPLGNDCSTDAQRRPQIKKTERTLKTLVLCLAQHTHAGTVSWALMPFL